MKKKLVTRKVRADSGQKALPSVPGGGRRDTLTGKAPLPETPDSTRELPLPTAPDDFGLDDLPPKQKQQQHKCSICGNIYPTARDVAYHIYPCAPSN